MDQDIERIKTIVETAGQRYLSKGGSVRLAAIEGGMVKIAPAGFCWR
jgi:uncharacterized protein (DUF1330 family)